MMLDMAARSHTQEDRGICGNQHARGTCPQSSNRTRPTGSVKGPQDHHIHHDTTLALLAAGRWPASPRLKGAKAVCVTAGAKSFLHAPATTSVRPRPPPNYPTAPHERHARYTRPRALAALVHSYARWDEDALGLQAAGSPPPQPLQSPQGPGRRSTACKKDATIVCLPGHPTPGYRRKSSSTRRRRYRSLGPFSSSTTQTLTRG